MSAGRIWPLWFPSRTHVCGGCKRPIYSADRNKAQDIVKRINALGQLTLVAQFLKDKLTAPGVSAKIMAAQAGRGIDAPTITISSAVYAAQSNVGDLYGLVLSYNLITSDKHLTPFDEFPGKSTVGGVRDALRSTMMLGWSQ